jgi:flavin reductase (DIM6/NTAB) family NADH-FMN oxidoreductase RutF
MDTLALTKIHYGMFIVTSAFDGKTGGQIANTVFQITSEPATIAVSISKQNNTHFLLENSKKFAVSCLTEETSFEFIGKFGFKSSKDFDKFAGTEFITSPNNIPIVTNFTNAYFETDIISVLDTETHTVFLGKLTNAVILNDKPSMTYDYYHKVKKGLTPKNAPTFIAK